MSKQCNSFTDEFNSYSFISSCGKFVLITVFLFLMMLHFGTRICLTSWIECLSILVFKLS